MIIIYFVLINLLTIFVYKHDKQASQNKEYNEWRVPERNLHILSLLGGWPGAIVAQETYRHKTIKQPFRKIFWLTVLINLLLIFILNY